MQFCYRKKLLYLYCIVFLYIAQRAFCDSGTVDPVGILPGISWSIETTTGIMTFEHIKNDYGKEIVIPYKSLAYTSATLFMNIKNFFDARTSVTLGFKDMPSGMVWTRSPEFYSLANAVEIDYKMLPDLIDFKTAIRPYVGYNYLNFVLKKDTGTSASAYTGYHAILFGIDGITYPFRWLRIAGFCGIAPFLISGVVSTNPYISYGGSISFYIWHFAVGISVLGKRSPKFLAINKNCDFQMNELGISAKLRF